MPTLRLEAKAQETRTNVQQAVPFFWVANLEASLRFYVDGLGFRKTKSGSTMANFAGAGSNSEARPTCCRSTTPARSHPPNVARVSPSAFSAKYAIAIYRDAIAHGLQPQRPFVGNAMWVTILTDPDGYKLDFESPTDAPEESSTKSESQVDL